MRSTKFNSLGSFFCLSYFAQLIMNEFVELNVFGVCIFQDLASPFSGSACVCVCYSLLCLSLTESQSKHVQICYLHNFYDKEREGNRNLNLNLAPFHLDKAIKAIELLLCIQFPNSYTHTWHCRRNFSGASTTARSLNQSLRKSFNHLFSITGSFEVFFISHE